MSERTVLWVPRDSQCLYGTCGQRAPIMTHHPYDPTLWLEGSYTGNVLMMGLPQGLVLARNGKSVPTGIFLAWLLLDGAPDVLQKLLSESPENVAKWAESLCKDGSLLHLHNDREVANGENPV